MPINKCWLIATLSAASVALTACGGGGGSEIPSGDITPPPPEIQPTPISPFEQERRQSLGLDRINADAAYNRGWTGNGVTLGYYESAIDASHPELSGKVADTPYAEIEPGIFNHRFYTLEQTKQHAQHVAGVAAAKRDAIGMHGVAYDSNIEFVSIHNETFNALIQEQYDIFDILVDLANIEGDLVDLPNIEGRRARAVNYLNGRVPIAFNASPGFIDWSDYTPEETEAFFAERSWISALRQTATSAAARTIWVYGAGNESLPYPIGAGYFPVHFPELKGHVIAAVALDRSGVIASYSNRCGAASAFCIAAPGRHYSLSGPSGYVTAEGTSGAAPTVAGSLAILKQAFPSLGNDELVTRLFATANKTGIYEVVSIYGQGLVDLDAATQPVGTTRILLSGPLSGPSSSESTTKIVSTPPFGDAFVNAFRDRTVMLLDELNAPFNANLSRFVTASAPTIVSDRLNDLSRQLEHPYSQHENDMSLQWFRLAGESAYSKNGLEFAAGKNDAIALAKKLELRRTGTSSLQLTTGALTEPETVLGAITTGAFGTQQSASLLAGLKSELSINDWQLSAAGMVSLTGAENRGGVLRSTTPILSSSFALEASRQTEHGVLRFTLSQPLRTETGRVKLTIPANRTPDKKIHYETLETDLQPSGRQIDLEMGYVQRIGANATLGAEFWLTKDPGHIGNAKPTTGIAAALRVEF